MFALSSNGAQLTMKKQSNTWILILILFNLPPELRCHSKHIIVIFATPGPNSPGNIESFMRPLFEELAVLGTGIWIWDALDSSYFIFRAHVIMVLGDMLGSAKMNGMSGHTAIFGDRFSLVQAAKASLKSGSKAQYYPLAPPQSDKYNPTRPETYDLSNLPIRDQATYWKILEKLSAPNIKKADIAKISKETGVSRIPLVAALPGFLHPSFFPVDPFHLFYENCMPFIWDLWTGSKEDDPIHIDTEKIAKFGELVSTAMKTLPPIFCGTIRNTHLKRQSQYKAYEWMALLHWYILPIGLELEFDFSLLRNFSLFAEAVDVAMKISSHSKASLAQLQDTIHAFLRGYEFLYVGTNPENVTRSRLCIFQLVHIPQHILWYGSIRNSSQATVEREIGAAGHQIHSKRDIFANLTNIIIEKEMIRILQLYEPSLSPSFGTPNTTPNPANASDEDQTSERTFSGRVYTRQDDWSELGVHWDALERCLQHLEPNYTLERGDIVRFGKLKLGCPKQTLRSQLGEGNQSDGYNQARSYRWFEVSLKLGSSEVGLICQYRRVLQLAVMKLGATGLVRHWLFTL